MSNARQHVVPKNQKALAYARSRQYIVKFLEYLNASAMFGLFMHAGTDIFLAGVFRFIFFPAAIILNLAKMLYIFRQAQLERRLQGASNPGTIVNALLELAVTGAISVALIGGLVAQATFSFLTPAILVLTIATKAVWDLGKSIYHFGKAVLFAIHERSQSDTILKNENFKSFGNNILSAVTTFTIAASVALLLFSNLIIFSGIGLAAAVISASTTLWLRRDRATVSTIQNAEPLNIAPINAPKPDSTQQIGKLLRIEYGAGLYKRKIVLNEAVIVENGEVNHYINSRPRKNSFIVDTENSFYNDGPQKIISSYRPR
jgi:hypothetical protein